MALYLLETAGLLSSYELTKGLSGLLLGAPHWDSALQGLLDLALALAPLPFPPPLLADSKKQPLSEAGWSSVWLEFARRFPTGTQQVKSRPGRTSLSGHSSALLFIE